MAFFFQNTSKAQKISVDYIGSALLIASASCFILNLSLLDSHGTQTKAIIGLFFVIFIAVTGLLIVQVHRAVEPILAPKLFRYPGFSACIFTSISVAFPFFGAVVFMPLYLQVVRGLSPFASGLAMTPQIIGLVISSRAGGWYLARKTNHALLVNLGVTGVASGLLLIGVMMELHQNLLCLETALLILGLGGGLVRPNLIIAAQTAVSESETGAATSTLIFVHTLSGTAGVACAQTLMNAGLRAFFVHQSPHFYAHSKVAEKFDALALGSQTQGNMVHLAYGSSIAIVFLTSGVIASLGLVCAQGLGRGRRGGALSRL